MTVYEMASIIAETMNGATYYDFQDVTQDANLVFITDSEGTIFTVSVTQGLT